MVDAGLLEMLRARENTYALLSRVYRSEVSTEFLNSLFAGLAACGEAGDEYSLLCEFAESAWSSDPRSIESQLAIEYAHLFLNAGDPPHVYPHESVYTSADRLLMQEARNQVLAAYRLEGLDRNVDFNEPEDHVAIELEFMAYLCHKTAQALESGDRSEARVLLAKQREFLEKHILVWVPCLCDDLEQIAWSDFYRAIARITRRHLAFEPATLDELVQGI